MTVKEKTVSLSKIVEPRFLTLCKKPANRTAFKVVRDGKPVAKRLSRTKRSMSPVLTVLFPEGTTEEQARALMGEYGFEDYSIVEESGADGKKRWKAYRSDLEEAPKTDSSFTLASGVKFCIQRQKETEQTKSADEKSSIQLVAVEFDKELFPEVERCEEWLLGKGIDFVSDGIHNSDTAIVYRRMETPAGAEIGKVKLDNGVSYHIIRADTTDVPPGVIEVISEAAYGNWGWGQLDFGAMLADIEFSLATEEGLRILNEVLYQVLFWSDLPLAVRKELVTRALGQFSTYLFSMMDMLPTRTVILNRSDKESDMTTKVEKVEGTQPAAADDKTKAVEYLTRADLAQITTDVVTKSVEGVLAALDKREQDKQAEAKRTQEAKEAADKAAKVEQGAAAGTEAKDLAEQQAQRAEKTAESLDKVVSAIEKLNERLSAVEGTTVFRSANADPKQSKPDVFRGLLGGGKQAA